MTCRKPSSAVGAEMRRSSSSACGGAQMVEAAGRTSAQHLDRGKIGGELHIVICEMGQNRKYQMRKPVLEQEAVPQAFEQMIIEMLVRVDEARNDDHPVRIERASNVPCRHLR